MSNRRKTPPRPRDTPTFQKPQPKGGGVVVAFIHPGQTSAYFTTSMLAMMLWDQSQNRSIIGLVNEWSSANVSAARNSLTQKFVDDYGLAEWLLWIDADMAWDHDALERLLAVADPVKAPIVGGLCFGANHDRLFPTIYQMTERDGLPTTIRVADYPEDAMMQCVGTGAAFLLIHRTVLETMRVREFNRAFPWFQETELSGQPAGEDLTFCLRAGICGFPIHVNTGVKIGHHKSHLLTHDLYQDQDNRRGWAAALAAKQNPEEVPA